MSEPVEVEVRILRGFGRYHRDQRVMVSPERLEWLVNRGFVEPVKRRRRARKAPEFKLAMDGTSEGGRTDAPPTGEDIEP